MCEVLIVEVLQALSCIMQLLGHLNEGSDGDREATYQFQSVGVILSNVFHDGPMLHPFGNSGESTFVHVPIDTNKLHDVRMGQRIPEDSCSAKSLWKDDQNRGPSGRKNTVDAHLSYLRNVIFVCNSQSSHRDEVLLVHSGSDNCKSTGGDYPV